MTPWIWQPQPPKSPNQAGDCPTTHCRPSSSRQIQPSSADCSSLQSGPAHPLPKSLQDQAGWSPPAEEKVLRTRTGREKAARHKASAELPPLQHTNTSTINTEGKMSPIGVTGGQGPHQVNSNRNQSLALQATGSRRWEKSSTGTTANGPERARRQWRGLCTLCNRSEALAGAGCGVGSKHNLSGRWAGEEKQQAEKSLTLAPAPAIKPKKDPPLEPDRHNPLALR